MVIVEIETISLLVRLYQHKIDNSKHPAILKYAQWYYANQDTDDIDHYIRMCLVDLWLESLIEE